MFDIMLILKLGFRVDSGRYGILVFCGHLVWRCLGPGVQAGLL